MPSRANYLRALEIDVWERRDLPKTAGDSPAIALNQSPPPPARTAASAPRSEPDLQAEAATASATAGMATAGMATAGMATAAMATAAMDWDTLEKTVRSCTRCPLHATRTQAVFGVGNRMAQWMVIGEAPGAEEDHQGEPFVGRAGQLLNTMLNAMGLAREQVFIANILKSRPPGNRDPRPEEVRACIPYLYRQIELVNPVLILCVGRIAAQTLLETETTIGKLRGKVHHLASGRPMIVTYHPAYLLRSPGEKRKSWADLLMALQTFERLSQSENLVVEQGDHE
jgi:DNA polymerase